MTDPGSKKQGFKKCRSATFSIDGFSFTIGEQKDVHASVCVCARERERECVYVCVFTCVCHSVPAHDTWEFMFVSVYN